LRLKKEGSDPERKGRPRLRPGVEQATGRAGGRKEIVPVPIYVFILFVL